MWVSQRNYYLRVRQVDVDEARFREVHIVERRSQKAGLRHFEALVHLIQFHCLPGFHGQLPTAMETSYTVVSGRCGAILAHLHRGQFRNIPQHLNQFAGIDLVEEAVELDMLRHRRAGAKQLKIVPERLLEIQNGHAIAIE
jgi:hypothetical protein